MTRLFYPSNTEAVTCRRCGNSMPADTETCPHCGADQGGMLKPANAAALPTGLRMPFTARRDSARVASPYPSLPEQSDLIGIEERHWDRSKSITLVAVALALGVGGVIYWQHSDSDSTPNPAAGQSASGPIDAKLAHDESTSTSKPATAVTGAPSSKLATTGTARPAPQHGTAPATMQAAIAPVVPAPTAVAPRGAAPAATARDNGSTAAWANVGDNLQAARDAMDRGDLTTARRRFSKIPASQLDTANVQRTQADLVRLEHTRDDMLQAARGCEATGSWTCVRQNAREVLAVDASNAEAQSMVEQAITRSGWLTQSAPATTAHVARPTPAPTTTPVVAAPAPSTLNPNTHLIARSTTVPHPPVPVPVPVQQQASVSTRIATGSHVPLTSSTYAPAPSTPYSTTVQHAAPPPYLPPSYVPPTITRSEPSQPVPVRSAAIQSSASPVTEPVAVAPRAPTLSETVPVRVESAQGTNGTNGTNGMNGSNGSNGNSSGTTTQIPQPPVARAAIPATDPAVHATPPAVSAATGVPATHTVARTVASTDGAASGAQAKAAFSGANPDDEERAIREFGWKKGDLPKPTSIAPSTTPSE